MSLLAHEVAGVLERSDLVSELTDMSRTDPLTGILNRRAWDDGVDAALRRGDPFTIAIIDLDRFKQFNDGIGHLAGDRLLREVAATWRDRFAAATSSPASAVRSSDAAPAGDASSAREVIERCGASCPMAQTCSAGFAVHIVRASRPRGLTGRADAALYEAKASGRDRALMGV